MPNEAKSLALRWLSQRSLSIQETEERLARRGMSEEEIAEAIRDLTELGFLNDQRLADQIAERSLGHHEGPRRLSARLMERRIESGARHQIMDRVMSEVDWLEIAVPLRERYDIGSPKGRDRLVRHLAREGFPAFVIREVAYSGGGSDDTDGSEDD